MSAPATAANIIINELMPRLKRAGLEVEQSPVKPHEISALALLKEHGYINHADVRRIMDEFFTT